MKAGPLLYIAAVILFNPAVLLRGSMVVITVDSTNISAKPFIVKTDPTDYGRNILFRIIADPKGPPYAPDDNMHFSLGGASLSTYDGSNCIASCVVASQDVPSNMRDVNVPLPRNAALFEFTVGTNYVNSAVFKIGYGSALHPAIDQYRFALPTFVPATDVGLSLSAKDGQIEIARVLPDSAAARAGLSPGLAVQQIDGVETARLKLDQAEDMLNAGSLVHLDLLDTSNGKTNDVLLTSGKIFTGTIAGANK
jgi:PDZ domain